MPIKKIPDSLLPELFEWRDRFKLTSIQLQYWLENEKGIVVTSSAIRALVKREEERA